jgi:long-chain fatty acid transport protein
MRTILRGTAAAVLAVATGLYAVSSFHGSSARASGFAIKEQSTTALGNAFAGSTAGAEDISYMFFNPAVLTRHDGMQAAVSGSLIIPQAEFENGSASRSAGPFNLGPIAGNRGKSDIGQDAFVPATYGSFQLTDDLHVGLGVNAPFGLVTDNDANWIGRYHAVTSELATININPAVAYEALPWLSVGAGFRAQYIDARLTNAVDMGAIFLGAGGAGTADGFAELEGDDWGYGYNFGVLIHPTDDFRVGLAYRSQISHELEGDVNFDVPAAVAGAAAATGLFANTGVTAKVVTPASLSIGAHLDLNEQWAIMGEFEWTEWSEFQELRIRFDNPVQPDSVTPENWNDSVFLAAGVSFRPTEDLTLRTGVAYDESPIPDAFRTPRIPGNDRYWIAFGAGWEPFDWLSLDAGYTHIFVEDGDVNLTSNLADPTDPNRFRGNLSGTFENSIDIVTVQGTVRF